MNAPAPLKLPDETPPFELYHDAWGRLVLVDAAGAEHVGCEPVRSFPLSDPERFISLCDAQGRELVCVARLETLPERVRSVLVDALARREFVPVVTAILHIDGNSDPTTWTVRTDRGETSFVVSGEDDIRRLGRHRALVVDRGGIRYLIPDARQLDAASRRLLERFL